MPPLKVFIGWDRREALAFHVLTHSILTRTGQPVEIVPLRLDQLRREGLYRRPTARRDAVLWDAVSDAPMATEFALSRFLVPRLAGYRGWAVFLDCDMLCLGDIAALFAQAQPEKALQCVQHTHRPRETRKMDGQLQSAYPRKNWSSAMLWNCAHPAHRRLTDRVFHRETGRALHGFCWLRDQEIGALPPVWNWLVGEQPQPRPLHLAHYTTGGPWFPDHKPGPFDTAWLAERDALLGRRAAA